MSRRVDPRPQALARLAVAVAAALISLEVSAVLARVPDGALALPAASWLPAVTDGGVVAWVATMLAASLALGAGLHSRSAAALISTGGCWALAWEQQTYSNHLVLLVLISGLLALGRPGAAWALDSRSRPREAVPYWPQLLMMTQVSVLYAFAGLSKVNDYFLSGGIFRDHMWLPVPDALLPLIALAAVVTEVGLAVALWRQRGWWFAAAAGIALHVSIVIAMRNPLTLFAFGLLTVSVYPMFADRRGAREPVSTAAGPVGARAAA